MSRIALITELPKFVTPAEHRQLVESTPVSFNDIPPVLRYEEEAVAVTLDPPLEGFSTEDAANGTLYIIESMLVFMSVTGKGFQVGYPAITLHAISRTEPSPSIYCQLDETTESQNEAVEDAEEFQDMRELKLIPTDSQSLELIFETLSQCAALHPDPEGLDDEMDDAFTDPAEGRTFEIFTGDEEQELSEVGRASLAYLESIIEDPHRRLRDSEEEETTDNPPPQVNGS